MRVPSDLLCVRTFGHVALTIIVIMMSCWQTETIAADSNDPKLIIITFDESGSMGDWSFDHKRLLDYTTKVLFYGISAQDIKEPASIRVDSTYNANKPLYSVNDEVMVFRFSERITPVQGLDGPLTERFIRDAYPKKFGDRTDIAAIMEKVRDICLQSGKDTYWFFVSDDRPEPPGNLSEQRQRITRVLMDVDFHPLLSIQYNKSEHPPYVEIRKVVDRAKYLREQIVTVIKDVEGTDPNKLNDKGFDDLRQRVIRLEQEVNRFEGGKDELKQELKKLKDILDQYEKRMQPSQIRHDIESKLEYIENRIADPNKVQKEDVEELQEQTFQVGQQLEKFTGEKSDLEQRLKKVKEDLAQLRVVIQEVGAFRCLEPKDGAITEVNKGVIFSWEPAKNVIKYELVVNANGQEFMKQETAQIVTDEKKLPEGNYNWFVSAINAVGNRRFNDDGHRNLTIVKPLGEFTLLEPGNNVRGVSGGNVNFTWTSSPNASYYDVSILKGDQVYRSIPRITQCMRSEGISESGEYKWTVVAFSENGQLQRKANQTLSFRVQPPLISPILVYPTDGNFRPTGPVRLSWRAAEDIKHFEVEIKGPEGKTTKAADQNYLDYILSKGGNYSWQVFAVGLDGKDRIGSDRWLIDTIGVEDFDLVEPNDGRVMNVGPVVFKWTAAENATKYALEISTEGQEPKSISTSGTQLETTLDKMGDYRWTVFAIGPDGQQKIGVNSGSRAIRITGIVPPVPERPGPKYKQRAGKVTFLWRASGETVDYLVEVFKQDDGQDVIYRTNRTREPRTIIDFNEPGNYTWTVSAIGKLGETCRMKEPPIQFEIQQDGIFWLVTTLVLVLIVVIGGFIVVVERLRRLISVELITDSSPSNRPGDNVFRLAASPGTSGDDNRIYLYASEQDRPHVLDLQMQGYYIKRKIWHLYLINEAEPDERQKISFGVPFTIRRPDGSEVTVVVNAAKLEDEPPEGQIETDEEQDKEV